MCSFSSLQSKVILYRVLSGVDMYVRDLYRLRIHPDTTESIGADFDDDAPLGVHRLITVRPRPPAAANRAIFCRPQQMGCYMLRQTILPLPALRWKLSYLYAVEEKNCRLFMRALPTAKAQGALHPTPKTPHPPH